LAKLAKEHGKLNEFVFRRYCSFSGNLDVLAICLKESRTDLEEDLVSRALWDDGDDEVVLRGNLRAITIVEGRRGKGSIEFRRNWLEVMGKTSREPW